MKYSKIGDVEFSATTEENVRYENEVTDRPVEDLGYISDHVKQRPIRFDISGIVTGDDAYSKLKLLRKYTEGKQVYTYFGRNIMESVVIESFTTSHGKNIRNGFNFDMSLKIIKRANSKTVTVTGADTGTDTTKTANIQKYSVKTEVSPVKVRGKRVNTPVKVDKEQYDAHKTRAEKTAQFFKQKRRGIYHQDL